MRVLVFLGLVLLACLASSTPIDHKRQLINRPPKDVIFRSIRSDEPVKGRRRFQIKGAPQKPEPSLRKGEYMCGDRVCKLKPGESPPGCNGVCQYRVKSEFNNTHMRN